MGCVRARAAGATSDDTRLTGALNRAAKARTVTAWPIVAILHNWPSSLARID